MSSFGRIREAFESCLRLGEQERDRVLRVLPASARVDVEQLLAIADQQGGGGGRYVPERVLDAGGRGLVFSARDRRSEQLVVLKMFRVHEARRDDAEQRLCDLALATRDVQGFVPWLDTGVGDGRVGWVVSEDRTSVATLAGWGVGREADARVAVLCRIDEIVASVRAVVPTAGWPSPRHVLVERGPILLDAGLLDGIAVDPTESQIPQATSTPAWHACAAALFPGEDLGRDFGEFVRRSS